MFVMAAKLGLSVSSKSPDDLLPKILKESKSFSLFSKGPIDESEMRRIDDQARDDLVSVIRKLEDHVGGYTNIGDGLYRGMDVRSQFLVY